MELSTEQINKLRELRNLQQNLNNALSVAENYSNPSSSVSQYLMSHTLEGEDPYGEQVFLKATSSYLPSNWSSSDFASWNNYKNSMNTINNTNDDINTFLFENEELPGVQDYFSESRRRQGGNYGGYTYNPSAVSAADKLDHLNTMLRNGRTLDEFGSGTASNDFNNELNRVDDDPPPTEYEIDTDEETTQEEPEEITDQEKRQANLRAERNSEPLPYPNLSRNENEEPTTSPNNYQELRDQLKNILGIDESLTDEQYEERVRILKGDDEEYLNILDLLGFPPNNIYSNADVVSRIQDLLNDEGQVGVLENQLQRKQEQLDGIQSQLDTLEQDDIDDETVKQNLKNELSEAEAERDRIQGLLDAAASQISGLETDLQSERSQHQDDINRLTEELAQAHSDDTADDSSISNLESQINEKQQLIEELNKKINDGQNNTSWLGFVPDMPTNNDRRLTGTPSGSEAGDEMLPGDTISGPMAPNVEDLDNDGVPDVGDDDITVQDEDVNIDVDSGGTSTQFIAGQQQFFESNDRPSPLFTDSLLKNIFDVSMFGIKTIAQTNPELLATIEAGQSIAPILKSTIDSIRHHNKNPSKINIFGGVKNLLMNEQHFIKNPSLAPFIALVVLLYIEKKDFNIGAFNFMVTNKDKTIQFLKVIYDFVKVDEKFKNFIEYCVRIVPEQISTSFLKNAEKLTDVLEGEHLKEYQRKVIEKFQIEYNSNLFDELHAMSGKQDFNIHTIFDYLDSPFFLFELNQIFNTFDDLLLEVFSSKETFIGLINLILAEISNNPLLSHQELLDKANIDGIVFYKKLLNRKDNEDIDLKLLKNMGKDNINEYNKKFENEDFTIYENDKDDLKIIFKQTTLKNYNHLIKNVLIYQGKEELFNEEKYNKSLKHADFIINKYKQDKNISISGFSLGGVMALFLGMVHPEIKTNVYSPVLPKNDLWDSLINQHQEWENIKIYSVEGDAISRHLKDYKGKLPIFERKKKDLLSHHDLNNF